MLIGMPKGAIKMRMDRGASRRAAIVLTVGLALTSCEVEDEPSATSRSDAKAAPTVTSAEAAASTPTPAVTTKIVTKTKRIPFKTVEREDPELDVGRTELIQVGEPGTRSLTYEITLTDGVETSRVLVEKEVTKQPVNKIIAIGTYEPPPEPEPEPEPQDNCDPNYSGCVPVDSDVDCAGGSGNGPSYVAGPVEVIGSDIYDLDADSDRVACE